MKGARADRALNFVTVNAIRCYLSRSAFGVPTERVSGGRRPNLRRPS